jgi:hypothetical protein
MYGHTYVVVLLRVALHPSPPIPPSPPHLFPVRTLLILFCLLALSPAHGQFGSFMRKILVGDTTAPPDHDTAYIATYKKRFIVSAVSNYRETAIDVLDTASRSVTFTTNNNTQYGAGIDFKWFSVEATFTVPQLDQADPRYGSTTSRSFALGYTGRRLWGRAMWNRSQGFFPDQPRAVVQGWQPTDAYPLRPDLTSETWLISFNYALSKKRRYSQNAALWQIERQKRSAGTWIVGASFWHTILAADRSLVPTQDSVAFSPDAWITNARRTLLGATIGYTHTFVLWHKGFIHLSLLTGAASRNQERQIEGREQPLADQGVASLTELKGGMGYNGDRWYTAITTAYYLNSDTDEQKVGLGSTSGNVRFALGWRFAAPRIKGLEKIGL